MPVNPLIINRGPSLEVRLDRLLRQEEARAIRKAERCPHCDGWLAYRQVRFGYYWRWLCCGLRGEMDE